MWPNRNKTKIKRKADKVFILIFNFKVKKLRERVARVRD